MMPFQYKNLSTYLTSPQHIPKPTLQKMIELAIRRKICEDTISRSPQIAASTPGGSLESKFIPSQLPPLSKSSPSLTLEPIQVLNSDSFAAARDLLTKPSQQGEGSGQAEVSRQAQAERKIAVLNLASDSEQAGGWRYSLSLTQEEALCYSSTLFSTLKLEWYPWENLGPSSTAGIYSPSIVVFRDTLDNDLVPLPEDDRFVVSVITVSAPRLPELTPDRKSFANESDVGDLREKVRLVLRMAAEGGNRELVLGAMGCGAYGCPPGLVAREMRGVIGEGEFEGWFERIVFAVYARGRVGKENFEVFEREFSSGV